MNKLIIALNTAFLISVLFFTACKEDESIQLPEPPSELTITAVSDTQIGLAWTDNSVSEDGFKIERKSGLEDFILLSTVAKDVSIFTDTALMENTSYTYRVYAFNSSYELGSYSNEATSSTLGRPVISSTAITGITPFSAVGGGTITNDGGSTIIASGVVWGTSPSQTYKQGKGSVQFPLNKPLPIELIIRMVKFRREEILKDWQVDNRDHQ